MRAAMQDNFILYDSVVQSAEWRKMPEASYGVLWDLILQVYEPRPRELRFTKIDARIGSPLKVRKALADLVDRGLIVQTLTKPNRYALNFPPYSEYLQPGR